MIEDLDIYKSAKIYVDQYGEEALSKAMQRVEMYRESGNDDAMVIWNKIVDAIQWMESRPNLVDTTCH
jgi:hypothetical protein